MPEASVPLSLARSWITELDRLESLRSQDLRLWLASLERVQDGLTDLERWLSSDELARARRFVVEPARQRFIASRAAVRIILGGLTGADPAEVRFFYSDKGKPSLSSGAAVKTLRFNVSHSGDLALIVTSAAGEVGVDVETIQERPDLYQGAATYLAAAEQALLDRLPPAERRGAFYRIWTCKEAILKATGQGITAGLKAPDVSVVAAAGSTDLHSIRHAGVGWLVYQFQPAPGAQGAVAVEAKVN